MRVLVTGATGFIGRNVARVLREAGHDVVALARASSDAWKTEQLLALGATIANGDVTDRASLERAMHGCDSVVHTAAIVRLGRVDPEAMHRVNVGGTENTLAAAHGDGVKRFLHVSSIAALGLHADGVADERTPHSGVYTSPYERTKHLSTLMADQYAELGLPVVQAFPSVVFGRGDPNFGHYIKRYVKRKIPLIPAPETTVPLVHVEDLARGLLLAIKKGRRGDRYLFNQGEITMGDLFARLEATTGIPKPRFVVSARTARFGIRVAAAASRLVPGGRKLSPKAADFLGRERHFSNRTAVESLGWEPGDLHARLDETARYYAEKYGKR